MTSWYDIYSQRMNDRYQTHIKKKYKPFIENIIATKCTKYMELGCGAGNITKAIREIANSRTEYFIEPFRENILVDNCPKMLSLAIENNPKRNCIFLCSDITRELQGEFTYDSDRVAHSHGVLEHFEDDKIIDILYNAMKLSKKQVHYVPGKKYKTPSRGDERLLSVKDWEEILTNFKRYVVHPVETEICTFNDGYDILININRKF